MANALSGSPVPYRRNALGEYRAQGNGRRPLSMVNALQMASMLPGVGDFVGPVADAAMFTTEPESRTAANYALAALGLLPIVPSFYALNRIAGSADNVSDLAKRYPRQKGIFAGINAKTADLAKLDEAKALREAGGDAADIWRKTGWGVGPDGKWRFEIPDNTSALESGGRFFGRNGGGGEASQVLEHKALFAAYPDEGRIPTIYDFNKMDGGSFDGNEIRVNTLGAYGGPVSMEQAKSTTIHELQHAIQKNEGFAKGGAPGAGADALFDYNAPKAQALMGQAKALEQRLAEIPYLVGDNVNPEFKRIQNEIYDLERQAEREAAFRGYQRLAGEAEARMTQARMNMTPRARSLRYPWEPEYFEKTTGVPINNLIIR